MRQAIWARYTLITALGFGLVTACNREPGPGDDCKPQEIRCLDPKTELACQKGKFIAAPCKGPLGCREEGKHLVCDFTGNAEGDVCSTEEDGNAKCIGEDRRITCRGGKYTIDHCRGPEGCRSTGTLLRCDQSKAEEGDPCRSQTNACSLDGKRVLSCADGRFHVAAQCPGEGGCSITGREVSCDLGKKEDEKGARKAGK
jgi:hypothetical protein